MMNENTALALKETGIEHMTSDETLQLLLKETLDSVRARLKQKHIETQFIYNLGANDKITSKLL